MAWPPVLGGLYGKRGTILFLLKRQITAKLPHHSFLVWEFAFLYEAIRRRIVIRYQVILPLPVRVA